MWVVRPLPSRAPLVPSLPMVQRRNSELHSGSLPFDGLNTSAWLSQFYAACEALLSAQDASLKDVFGEDETTTANTLVQAQLVGDEYLVEIEAEAVLLK